MRRLILTLAAFASFAVASSLWFARSEWSGQLVDANCANPAGGARACIPTPATAQFGLVVAGRAYKLDYAGNQKAQRALKLRSALSDDPAKLDVTPVTASILGNQAGETTLILVSHLVLE